MGAKEVAAGAAWLDENFPGWEREIDLGKLNLNDGCNCILGQSLARFVNIPTHVNGYGYGVDLAVDGEDGGQWSVDHGFLFRDNERLWWDLIKERFSSGLLSDEV